MHVIHIESEILRKYIQFGSNVEVLDCAVLFYLGVGTLVRKNELCHLEDGI